MKMPGITENKLVLVFFLWLAVSVWQQGFSKTGGWKPAFNENGYVSSASVTHGDTLRFYISTVRSPYSIQIYKLGFTEKLVATYNNIQGGQREVPDSAYEKGCGWPESFSVKIPDTWKPGAYAARFPVDTGKGTSTVLFFVKENRPGSYSDIVLIMPLFNWVAYNTYGGKNVYDENSTEMKRAYRVSFHRPLFNGGYAEFRSYPYKMIKWLESVGYSYEVITELDVHKYPDLLKQYNVAIEAGHAEYWTRQQWINVENYINNGGKYLNLSGNTCWWQVRIENNDSTLVCYKNRDLDPLYGKVDSLVTVNWYDKPLNKPENLLLGASFRNAGYVDDINHKDFTHAQGYGGYSAHNTQHWVFNNTGLKDGDLFGRDPHDSLSSIVGYETDGALFRWENGVPRVLGTDGTPKNFTILGISPAIGQGDTTENRYATMGLYYTKKGGALFNAASIYWAYGLTKDPVVQTITKNIIDRFLSGKFPPEISVWKPYNLVKDTVNGQVLTVNSREYNVEVKDTLTFSIASEDPNEEDVKYAWYVNSEYISNEKELCYIPQKEGTVTIRGVVSNSRDTSSISWSVCAAAPTAVRPANPSVVKYDLEQNFPNPFNPVTNIKYALADESRVKLTVYDAIGQVIKVLRDNIEKAGYHNFKWEPEGLSSGVYFYSMEASALSGKNNYRAIRKMVYLK